MHIKPLISIIIPTYNRAQIIGDTLDSVLAQTYTNWECIVVDDGSSDNTENVIAIYCEKDARFQYHKRPKERLKGGNAARNYGFEVSNGEFIIWYDSDDVMLEEKLQQHINMFSNKTTIDATVTNSSHYNFISKKPYKLWREQLTSNNLISDFIALKAGWHTGDALWKLESLKTLSFNETLACAQDWEFNLNAIITGKTFVFKDQCLSYVRWTPGSIKNNLNTNYIIGSLLARASVLKMLKKHDKLDKENAALLLNDFYSYYEYLIFNFKIKFSITALGHIIYLSFKTKKMKRLISNLAFYYPYKVIKRILSL
ncbi:glycosyltransferase family 2 protein [Lacinutrix jangbogonensis]|uniref:glycosyltransferase family 2 protein n=1 Tax=Lacinutrix jangbogonensis TaxID=1469557 RepID=UPI000691FA37|nr:glycosyltransferase family A protein [Lacinutrix jangbogonensis]